MFDADNPKAIDYAYLAAIIDGEGYIGIANRTKGRQVIVVEATNTHLPLIRMLQQFFGGYVGRSGYRASDKPAYKWMTSCARAAAVIRRLLPYLFVKRRQAELAMEFQATMKNRGGRGVPGHVRVRRLLMASKMSTLNKRGVVKVPV